ncbi:gephyrin-like molybdotransferase Glp [Methylocaldum sp.]|uniref:molybdopterin molybdotransferase MoeA n=1 Tax=Methylocaldum sp. TaxID=1969727 RepID=UPI002D5BC1F3|nr:gephyrin-like molybdotransferase Glp [Methylocaldum sp.]HYE36358.1 gephyrin-like molybdotransferase Glp [Methylocaldum sp.]
MKTFTRYESVDEVLRWLDRRISALPPERIAVSEAYGRVLAEAVPSPIDVPPFDRAAVDGYAVHGLETIGAGAYSPVSLILHDTSLVLQPGTASRIAAGAPLPEGADTIVPLALVEETSGFVNVAAAVAPGENIARRGKDIGCDSPILPEGRPLRAQDLALLAACGIDRIPVIRRPKVRIVTTGDDLAVPGQPRSTHQHFEAGSSMLKALVARDGGEVEACVHVSDDAIAEALRTNEIEATLVVGSSGEGWNDRAAEALDTAGELAWHGIALEPGRSAGIGCIGCIGNTLVFLLAGDPVACFCAYDLLAGRAIRRMAGRSTAWPYPERRVVLTKKISSELGSVDYCRVRLTPNGAEPVATGGNTRLSALAAADGFLLVPEDCEGYPSGAEVTVFLYNSLDSEPNHVR